MNTLTNTWMQTQENAIVPKHGQLNASMCVSSGMTPYSQTPGPAPFALKPLPRTSNALQAWAARHPPPPQNGPRSHSSWKSCPRPTANSLQSTGPFVSSLSFKVKYILEEFECARRDFGCISWSGAPLFSTSGLEFLLFRPHLSCQVKNKGGCLGNIC